MKKTMIMLIALALLAACAPKAEEHPATTEPGTVESSVVADPQAEEADLAKRAAERLVVLERARAFLETPLEFDGYSAFSPKDCFVRTGEGTLRKVTVVSAKERKSPSERGFLPVVDYVYDDAGGRKEGIEPIVFGFPFGDGEFGVAQGIVDHEMLGKGLGTRTLVYRTGDRVVAEAPLWNLRPDDPGFHFDDPIAFATATIDGVRKLFLISRTRGGQFESEGISGTVLSEVAIGSGTIEVKRILYLESTVYGTTRNLVYRGEGGVYGKLALSEEVGTFYYAFEYVKPDGAGTPAYLHDFALGLKPDAEVFVDPLATQALAVPAGTGFEWIGIAEHPAKVGGAWRYLAKLKLDGGTTVWVDGSAFLIEDAAPKQPPRR